MALHFGQPELSYMASFTLCTPLKIVLSIKLSSNYSVECRACFLLGLWLIQTCALFPIIPLRKLRQRKVSTCARYTASKCWDQDSMYKLAPQRLLSPSLQSKETLLNIYSPGTPALTRILLIWMVFLWISLYANLGKHKELYLYSTFLAMPHQRVCIIFNLRWYC